MPKIASEMQHINAEDIKELYTQYIIGASVIFSDCFEYGPYDNDYRYERRSPKRARYCIDSVRNTCVAYLERHGLKWYVQNRLAASTQEEVDTFNDPAEVVKQAIIDRANSITIQDIYDNWTYIKPAGKVTFRQEGMKYVEGILDNVGRNAIDAFYASQPVCDCYVD